MLTIFVGNLPADTREDELNELFTAHGTVRSVRIVKDLFTGACRGIGFVEMEGHEARTAMAALHGKPFKGNMLKVNEERPRERRGAGRSRR